MDKSMLKKLFIQIGRLENEGYSLNEPLSKKLKGYDLYELRPVPYRIFYAAFIGDEFVLLHYFHKKSNRTPKKEIEEAKRNLVDGLERYGV
ncbi:type II toxin-antitoxin system RelE/ParE family toxin [Enterococcus gilvus]|uniref:type II toxin-antitoxin system RelE/ParE family toxin n=1 Tax=Enterococcus gilvus TaxID=160453 RepID=UPI003ED8CA8F